MAQLLRQTTFVKPMLIIKHKNEQHNPQETVTTNEKLSSEYAYTRTLTKKNEAQ